MKKRPRNFNGTSWVKMLIPVDSTFQRVLGTGTFTPGARSYCNKHNGDHILLVADGIGYTQQKEKSIWAVHKGNTIISLRPRQNNGHRATPGSLMTHISSSQMQIWHRHRLAGYGKDKILGG